MSRASIADAVRNDLASISLHIRPKPVSVNARFCMWQLRENSRGTVVAHTFVRRVVGKAKEEEVQLPQCAVSLRRQGCATTKPPYELSP
jgi:hypothetical protein